MKMNVEPYALPKEDSPALWFLGTLALVKATAKQTRGALGLIEQLLPAGFALSCASR